MSTKVKLIFVFSLIALTLLIIYMKGVFDEKMHVLFSDWIHFYIKALIQKLGNQS